MPLHKSEFTIQYKIVAHDVWVDFQKEYYGEFSKKQWSYVSKIANDMYLSALAVDEELSK